MTTKTGDLYRPGYSTEGIKMLTKVATGCFRDMECTCECGNKHELYGGIGYENVSCDSYTPAIGEAGTGYYYHSVRCRSCGSLSELKIIG